MKVEFIPAFYWAFARATALAELRPGIGDDIAIGKFSTRVPLKVFDFTVFEQRAPDRKPFFYHSRYEFITQMQDEISRPVRPHERQREYDANRGQSIFVRFRRRCEDFQIILTAG